MAKQYSRSSITVVCGQSARFSRCCVGFASLLKFLFIVSWIIQVSGSLEWTGATRIEGKYYYIDFNEIVICTNIFRKHILNYLLSHDSV